MSRKKRVKAKKLTQKKTRSSFFRRLRKFLTRKSKLFFLLGLSLIFLSAFYLMDKTVSAVLIQNISGVNSCTDNKFAPTRIDIPSQDISANIEDSSVVGNLWQISEEKVSRLRTSAVPGQNGNIIMYGHNTKNNFINLQFVQEGDLIILNTGYNKQYAYVVTGTKTVFPTDVNALQSKDPQVLTLYTCVGLGDTMRVVIHAVPAASALAKVEGKSCKG